MHNRRFSVTVGAILAFSGLAFAGVVYMPQLKSISASMDVHQTLERPSPKLQPQDWEARGNSALQIAPIAADIIPQTGLVVKPSHLARGDELKLHTQIARAMNAAKLVVPAHRLMHFRWLDQPQYRLVRWGGAITSIEAFPDGSLVTLQVTPSFQLDGGSATTSDYFLETYALVNGEIQFVRGVDPPDASPDILTD